MIIIVDIQEGYNFEVVKMLPKNRVPKKRKRTGGKQKKTHQQYCDELISKNIPVLPKEEYNGSKEKILHECLICGNIFSASPTNILFGKLCPICGQQKQSKSRRKTNKQYIEDLSKINPTIIAIEEYVNNRTSIKHKCLVCNNIFSAQPSNLLSGKGCPYCKKTKLSESHIYTQEKYEELLSSKNPNLLCVDKYKGIKNRIKHLDKECGHTFLMKPERALLGGRCLICKGKRLNKDRTFSHEHYLELLLEKNIDIKPTEEYQGMNTPIMHLHPCGHQYKSSPNAVLQNNSCKFCAIIQRGMKRKKTQEQFEQEVGEINPNIEILGEYIGIFDKIECKCKICDSIWNPIADAILRGHGCPNCANIRNGLLHKKTNEEYVNEIKNKYPNIIVKEEYDGASKKIKHFCVLCNREWFGTPSNTLIYGCPSCNGFYSGEQRIDDYLRNHKIEYTMYYSFSDLLGVGGRKLSYDFYLLKYNLLIEYQGAQHERPVDHFGGEEQFKKQQEHDKRKREYAKEHNINLLEIWYYDYDNIEEILTNYLNLETVETVEVA